MMNNIFNLVSFENGGTIYSSTSSHKNYPTLNILTNKIEDKWISEIGIPQEIIIDISNIKFRPKYFKAFGIQCLFQLKSNPKIIEFQILRNFDKNFISLGFYKFLYKNDIQIYIFDKKINFEYIIKLKIIIKETYGDNKTYLNKFFLFENFYVEKNNLNTINNNNSLMNNIINTNPNIILTTNSMNNKNYINTINETFNYYNNTYENYNTFNNYNINNKSQITTDEINSDENNNNYYNIKSIKKNKTATNLLQVFEKKNNYNKIFTKNILTRQNSFNAYSNKKTNNTDFKNYKNSTEYYSTSKKKQNIHTHEQFKNYSQNKNNNSSFNKIEKRMTSIEKEIKELNNKMDFFFNNYNDNKENNINIKNKSLFKTVFNKKNSKKLHEKKINITLNNLDKKIQNFKLNFNKIDKKSLGNILTPSLKYIKNTINVNKKNLIEDKIKEKAKKINKLVTQIQTNLSSYAENEYNRYYTTRYQTAFRDTNSNYK